MAFKKSTPKPPISQSPDELLRDLPRRKIPDVLPHQRETMRKYVAEAIDDSDVALQLPTGSGKTLVGLLIGEWLRLKNQERVVYLCPTRQLVNQVVEQAEEKYGLTVQGFTGSGKEYKPAAKAAYRNADSIAVTTYSSLFNTNPFFHDADILIVDDAHAGESYISGMWSLQIQRTEPKHSALHAALSAVLKPVLDPVSFARLTGEWEDAVDRGWVDKLPTPLLFSIKNELTEVFDSHVDGTEFQYPWSLLREHLSACQLFISSKDILLRPLIPPTWTHAPFTDPRQRIYMSATLGNGGDLERLVGRSKIKRLPIPDGWNRQGVGRRFFIFPKMSLSDEHAITLRRRMMEFAGRSLVLVPSERLRGEIAADIGQNLGHILFNAKDIEDSKKPFVATKNAVAIVANRYDGIDFPGDECRLLFIDGLPRAMNLQERFIMSRMGAGILFNERVQTRVLQAIGRCTRSLEDYSAVVVSGEELPDYISDKKRRQYFHPELQSELMFGLDQSKDTSAKDLFENFKIFLENGKEWEQVNQQILAGRKLVTQKVFPAMEELGAVVKHEIEYETRLWARDYEQAFAAAEKVLAGLVAPDLRGYRAMWHYLAGAAAFMGSDKESSSMMKKARIQFGFAKEAALGIPWLVKLAQFQSAAPAAVTDNSALMEQMERVEAVLEKLGTTHDRSYAQREKEILDGLESEDQFERAQELLGELLGFNAGKIENDGSPDPWWIAGNICLVFEDHVGAKETSVLDVKKARQVSSHPEWMRANVKACLGATILPVLVTPVTAVRASASAHLKDVAVWPAKEFRKWAKDALATVRGVRTSFAESGDLVWRANAADTFERAHLSAAKIYAELLAKRASNLLKIVE